MSLPAPDVLLCTKDETQWRNALERALPDVRLHVWPDAPDDVDFAIVWKPPPQVFERVCVRRAIFNLGAGVDALLSVPTLPRDVPIVRLEDAGMAIQMVEYVTLAILRAYREQDAYARAQREQRWAPRARIRKETFPVGLLGLGVLGQAVAAALRAFDFPLLGWSRTKKRLEGVTTFDGPWGLRDMLVRSRVLVVLIPATPQTRHLLDRQMLSLLPAGAHLVNVSRGALVVEQDLLALLDEGHLASATLDVFDTEPLPAGHRFWHHPGIVLTPHVSAATLIDESAAQVAVKLRAMMRNQPVGGVVDPSRGY